MTIPDYLLIGHIARDLTPQGPQLGGTVSYGAHTAAAFGLRVGILTSAAADEPLLNDLPPNAMVINVSAEYSTTFENRYSNNVRTQFLHHRAATLYPKDVPPEWRQVRLVHLGPIAYETDPSLISIFPESRICVTPQGFMRRREPDGRVTAIEWESAPEVLPHTTLTVLSREDIRHNPGLAEVFARLAPLMVLTEGERGGVVYRDGTTQRYDAIQATQIEPTGAGDVFAVALHIALDRLGDLSRAVQVAARLAGLSVTRVGLASAPTPDEVAEALHLASQVES